MATSTTTIACSANEWTQISTGSASVTAQLFSVGGTPIGFRIFVGTEAPDNSDTEIGLVSSPANGGFAGKGLTAGTDNVYVFPYGADGVAQVIAS